MKHSHFQRLSGVFSCRGCGHRTRDVNGSNGGLQLCVWCEEACGLENTISDGYGTENDQRRLSELEVMIAARKNKAPAP